MDKITPFIKNQFPEYLRDTQTLLIPFMEAYYEWLHQDGEVYSVVNDLANLQNIDESFDKFAEQFTEEYLKDFPKNILTDKTLTIKHIGDLYASKGTPKAVQLLLRMLFGKESEIIYPSEQILRASDGDWIQENSIYVTVQSGDIFDTVGNTVKIVTEEVSFDSVVERVKLTQYAGIYEVFLERKLIYEITKNTIVTFEDVILKSQQTIVKYRITSPGAKFRLGQIFNVDSSEGSGTVVKVKAVTETGGLKAVQIIKFGYGYESDFISSVKPREPDTVIISQFPNINDKINSINDRGFINKFDYYVGDYIDASYVGEILAEFSDNGSVEADPDSATIEFLLGNKLKYPGYYNSIKGFLSDSIYLQDNFYYQAYSYVIKIDEVLNKYKESVQNTVHPAGLKMFGEYSIKNNFSLNTQLRFILNFFRLVFNDIVVGEDNIQMLLSKSLTDFIVANDTPAKELLKVLIDSTTNSDESTNEVTKGLNDSVTQPDTTTTKSFGKSLTDTTINTDFASQSFDKALVDSFTNSDVSNNEVTKGLSDSVAESDTTTTSFGKSLTDTTINTDVATKSFDKSLVDSFNSQDANAINFGKIIDDVISSIMDNSSLQFVKYVEEILEASDDNQTFEIQKFIIETVQSLDVNSISMIKLLSDTISELDTITRTFEKSLTDTTINIDFASQSFDKPLTDSFTNEDDNSLQFTKSASDSVSSSDVAPDISTNKGINEVIVGNDINTISISKSLSDVIEQIDLNMITVSKILSDAITQNDDRNFSINRVIEDNNLVVDIQTISTTKAISETLFITDEIAIGFTYDKEINDSQNADDSGGYLYYNYYTTTDYFEEEYTTGRITF